MTSSRALAAAGIATLLAASTVAAAERLPVQDAPPTVELWAGGQWLQEGALGSYCWFDDGSESCQVARGWRFPARVRSGSRSVAIRIGKLELPSEIRINRVRGRGPSARYTEVRAIPVPSDDGSGWDFALQLEPSDSGTLKLVLEARWPYVDQCPPCKDEFAEWRFRVLIPDE